MIGYCPLASGSKGNSIFFGSKKTKILIDAGISFKQLEERLNSIGESVDQIDAVLITHDHMDHIGGLKVLCSKFPIYVLCNSETAKGIYENLHFKPKFKIFTTGESFQFHDLNILPFSVQHDTLDPVAFCISYNDLKVGICTDLGFVTSYVKKCLEGCKYLYVEANHEVDMVHISKRSFVYKQRVLGRQGHLSNDECMSLLSSIAHPALSHVFLAHLSDECNSKEVAIKKAANTLGEKVLIDIAYQEKISKKILFK